MTLINKWWKRFLIGAIVGGLFSETIGLMTDGKVELNAFIIGIVLYSILSIIYGIANKIKNVPYISSNPMLTTNQNQKSVYLTWFDSYSENPTDFLETESRSALVLK